jgi:polyhydroxyalkanoate synthesis regulator phasin
VPDNDPLRKYIDAGMVFTQLTRQRAEEIVRELIHNGEVNREQATRWVEELLERSRQSTELLLGVVRKELDDRISALNLVTRDDLANLAARITGVAGPRGASRAQGAKAGRQASTTGAKAAGSRATAAKTTGAKKSASAAGTKGAAKKAPAAKKAASKKTAATTKAAGATRSATAAKAGPASRPSSRPRKA